MYDDKLLQRAKDCQRDGIATVAVETTTLIRLIEAAQSAEAHKASRADMLIKAENWQDKELPSSGIYTHDYGM